MTAIMPAFTGIGSIGSPTPDANDWKAALLTAMGAPVTAPNLKALELWHTSEGTNPSTNNWLAISDGANKWPHGSCLAQCGTGSPIYAFPSQAVGVQATAAFLRGSYYTRVVDAFKNNAGMAAIFAAINASPWCKGCQSGHYPIALFQGLNGTLALSPSPPGSSSSGADVSGAVPISDTTGAADANPCLIGGGSVGPVGIPCLLHKSQGDAVVGALVLLAGGIAIIVGVVLLAGSSSTVRGAVQTVATKGKSAVSSSSAPSSSSSSDDTEPAAGGYRRNLRAPYATEERRGRMARAERDRPLKRTPSPSGRTTLITAPDADEEPF